MLSDAVQIAFLVVAFLGFLSVFFGGPIKQRIVGGAAFDGGFEGPGGLKAFAKLNNPPQLTATEKAELELSVKALRTDLPGHVFWLASDLTVVLGGVLQGDPTTILHYIRQCYWHATKLEYGEELLGTFERIWQRAKSFSVDDWNDLNRRNELQSELAALLPRLAWVAQDVQEGEFQANPPLSWNMIPTAQLGLPDSSRYGYHER